MVLFDVPDVKSREKAVGLCDTQFDRTSLEEANGSRMVLRPTGISQQRTPRTVARRIRSSVLTPVVSMKHSQSKW